MEFDPIYDAGIHDINLGNLDDIFVLPFPNNERRKYLTDRLRAFLDKFSEFGLNAEIWIDGSFSTLKPEPGDIDIVFFYDPAQLNNLTPDKQYFLFTDLFNRSISKIRYNCDVFFVPNDDSKLRSYWRGWFAFSRDEKPKGIPRINYALN